jgi:hypothetical protein
MADDSDDAQALRGKRTRARQRKVKVEAELEPQGLQAGASFDAKVDAKAELAPQGIKMAVGTRVWWRSGWREHRKGRRLTFDPQDILAALDAGETIAKIARRFGCSRTRVYQIRNARDRGVRNTR